VVEDLFSWGLGPGARPTDPETSHSAANLYPRLRGADRRRVLLVHERHPQGLTDFELAAIVGRQQTSAGKRRGELRDMGLIEDSGFRRAAPSMSPAIVWRITYYGCVWAGRLRNAGSTWDAMAAASEDYAGATLPYLSPDDD
jgi:hypothetical protein